MTYSATYDSDDIDDIVIDLGATALVALVAFGTIIGLVMLMRWFKGKKATGNL